MGDAPTLQEVLERAMTAQREEVRTWFPGRVRSFNRTTKLAQLEPLILLDGRELPIMPDVRVAFPGPYWDLQAGETGIVLVGWRSWAGWRRSGNASAPEDEGLHELDYATFIPGLWSDADARSSAHYLPTGGMVLASSNLLLGSGTATEAVVLGTSLRGDLDTYLLAQAAWVNAVAAAVPAVAGAASTFVNAISALASALPDDLSTTVKVAG